MNITRRHFTQGLAAATAVGATPLVWAADTVKIGYVSPQTGPLAAFGETDKWVVQQMTLAFKDGIVIGGKKYAVQIVLKDSQSNPNRAGEVANDLILKDKVALMLTADCVTPSRLAARVKLRSEAIAAKTARSPS